MPQCLKTTKGRHKKRPLAQHSSEQFAERLQKYSLFAYTEFPNLLQWIATEFLEPPQMDVRWRRSRFRLRVEGRTLLGGFETML